MSLTLRVAHASGRFDVDAAEVAAYLAENIKRYRLDLLTTTESQQRGIAAHVAETLGPAFGVVKRGEYLCAFRRTALVRRRRLPRVLHVSHVLGLIGWRQMRVAVFPLEVKALGIPLDSLATHTPTTRSSVAAWERGHRRLGRWLARRARLRPNLLQLVGADENRDLHRDAARHHLAALLHALSIWHDRRPAIGSHGGRLIDTISFIAGARVHVAVVDAWVSEIPRPPGYDHRLVGAELRITWEAAS